MTITSKIKAVVLSIAFFAFSTTAFAQIESSIYFSPSIPIGDFASDANIEATGLLNQQSIGTSSSFIGLGFTYRAGYVFDINVGLIEPFVEAGFNWHRINSDARDAHENFDFSIPTYFNIPIMAGINYRYPIDETFAAYAEFAIGGDMMFITPEEGTYPNDVTPYGLAATYANKEFSHKYSITSAVNWQIGAGVVIGQYFSVGLSYMDFGRHKMSYSTKTTNEVQNVKNKAFYRTLGGLMIRFGFHF